MVEDQVNDKVWLEEKRGRWDGWMGGLLLVQEVVPRSRSRHDKGTTRHDRLSDWVTDGVDEILYEVFQAGPGESVRGWKCGSGSGNWRLVSF